MRKVITFFILFFLMISSGISNKIQEIAVIKINESELQPLLNYTFAFKFKKSKTKDKFQCYYIHDILEKYIKHINDKERKSLFIEIENSQGSTTISTYSDFDTRIVRNMPFIIFKTDKGSIGDTVKVYDKVGQKGVVDLEAIGKEFSSTIITRIHLNVKQINPEEQKLLFKQGSVIYPQDIATLRWLPEVVRIKIYQIVD